MKHDSANLEDGDGTAPPRWYHENPLQASIAQAAWSEARVIFIDSNIPMYLIGAPHSNKDIARRLLEQSINRREAIRPAFDAGFDQVPGIERV